uniref:Acid phosphatase n=1 Tax=Oryza glumipatula TaxID=40148 RepID=A0A0D9ZV50_9ORYZ
MIYIAACRSYYGPDYSCRSAPALAGTLRLYRRLFELGIKPVFLTVRTENQRAVTIRNLSQQGYSGWEKLVLQPTEGLSIEAFKSGERQKLVSDGYAIVGNIGDQWSDLLGPAAGARTFKLSNPIRGGLRWSMTEEKRRDAKEPGVASRRQLTYAYIQQHGCPPVEIAPNEATYMLLRCLIRAPYKIIYEPHHHHQQTGVN